MLSSTGQPSDTGEHNASFASHKHLLSSLFPRYLSSYNDTDSSLQFPTVEHPTPHSQFCQINNRLGGLKVEADNIRTYVGQQSKTYMTVTTSGEVTTKCKGFSMLSTLLDGTHNERIVEELFFDSLTPFMLQCLPDADDAEKADGLAAAKGQWEAPKVKIYQKQITIDPRSLAPDVRERPNFVKRLRMCGPRRIIHGKDSLSFDRTVRRPRLSSRKIARPRLPPSAVDASLCSDDNAASQRVQAEEEEEEEVEEVEEEGDDGGGSEMYHTVTPGPVVLTYPFGYQFPAGGKPFEHLMK